ncbi:MAG TPA: hypothetical protein VLT36_00500 [Candidatus Dormibacteraeota bacterium]|nr:hypothetical protein [Candidatus Dormibacteraeota bacterium]
MPRSLSLRIAAAQLLDQLMRFTASAEADSSGQPEKLARVVNALSRLTREALSLQKYRDALAKTAATELAERDPDRDLADEELRLLVNKMDRTFKVARPNLDAILNGTPDRKRRQPPSPSSSVSSPANPTPSIEHPGSAQLGDSPESKIKIQNSKIASDCSSRPDEAVFFDPTQHASNGTKPPPINTPVHPGANDTPPSRTASTVSESAALINTPIHRGANDAPPSPTVSTVSEPAHSQAPPDPAQSKTEIQIPQQSTQPLPAEHCLQCGDPLPPLLPDGSRPSPWCACGGPIAAPPGFSIRELCPYCSAPIPVHGYNTKRWSGTCSECKQNLPPLDPNAPLKWLLPTSEFQERARNLH